MNRLYIFSGRCGGGDGWEKMGRVRMCGGEKFEALLEKNAAGYEVASCGFTMNSNGEFS